MIQTITTVITVLTTTSLSVLEMENNTRTSALPSVTAKESIALVLAPIPPVIALLSMTQSVQMELIITTAVRQGVLGLSISNKGLVLAVTVLTPINLFVGQIVRIIRILVKPIAQDSTI